ncbi:MAG TPA: 50S ribosomal protein L13 [Acidobacteriota bacterium]
MTKTVMTPPSQAASKWLLLDAQDAVLGRLSCRVATLLLGKHKASFTPQWDHGDHVVVINAEKIKVTGKKESDKFYYRYSGYPGGITAHSVAEVRKAHPERLILNAVRGMLPKTRLGRQMLKKLRVYAGPSHPHEAQNPQAVAL